MTAATASSNWPSSTVSTSSINAYDEYAERGESENRNKELIVRAVRRPPEL